MEITYARNFSDAWFRRIELQTDVYYNQVEDKIIAMPTSNQFRWTMLNLGYVEIKGIDAAVQGDWHIGRVEFSTRLNYTYQKAQDFTDPESKYYGGQIPYIPWHSATAILSGSHKTWSWNYSFIYTGELYEAVANIRENYAQMWYTHDLGLSKRFLLGRYELRVTAEVKQLVTGSKGAAKNRMAVVGDKVFVPTGKSVYVIQGDAIVHTIAIPGTVSGVVRAYDNNLWISCTTTPAQINKVSSTDYSILQANTLGDAIVGAGVAATPGISAKADSIYFSNASTKIYRHIFNQNKTELMTDVKSHIDNAGIVYNNLAVNPKSGEVYFNFVIS